MHNLVTLAFRNTQTKIFLSACLFLCVCVVKLTNDIGALALAIFFGLSFMCGMLFLEFVIVTFIVSSGVRYARAERTNGTTWVNAMEPERGSDSSAGYDLFYAGDEPVTIQPGQMLTLPTGWCFEIPYGWGGFIKDRSSVATKDMLVTHAGVIDSDYRGHVHIVIHNLTSQPVLIPIRKKLAQIVFLPCMYQKLVQTKLRYLSQTQRGEGGFGSSDVKKEK